jgi:hypothetical protein
MHVERRHRAHRKRCHGHHHKKTHRFELSRHYVALNVCRESVSMELVRKETIRQVAPERGREGVSSALICWMNVLHRCLCAPKHSQGQSPLSLVFFGVQILAVSVLTEAVDHGFNEILITIRCLEAE